VAELEANAHPRADQRLAVHPGRANQKLPGSLPEPPRKARAGRAFLHLPAVLDMEPVNRAAGNRRPGTGRRGLVRNVGCQFGIGGLAHPFGGIEPRTAGAVPAAPAVGAAILGGRRAGSRAAPGHAADIGRGQLLAGERNEVQRGNRAGGRHWRGRGDHRSRGTRRRHVMRRAALGLPGLVGFVRAYIDRNQPRAVRRQARPHRPHAHDHECQCQAQRQRQQRRNRALAGRGAIGPLTHVRLKQDQAALPRNSETQPRLAPCPPEPFRKLTGNASADAVPPSRARDPAQRQEKPCTKDAESGSA